MILQKLIIILGPKGPLLLRITSSSYFNTYTYELVIISPFPSTKWTHSGHKVDTKWKQSGHKVDTKWTQSGKGRVSVLDVDSGERNNLF